MTALFFGGRLNYIKLIKLKINHKDHVFSIPYPITQSLLLLIAAKSNQTTAG